MTETKCNRVLVGEFGRAHGVRGEVRLKSFTGEPAAIKSYNPLQKEDGSLVVLSTLRSVAGTHDMFIVRVEGISTREAAEALTRQRLYVERQKLQSNLEEDEFLQIDIIGACVENEGGEVIGRLVAFHDFGGGDVIEIIPAPNTGRRDSVLLPFTKAFVPIVDVPAKRIVVSSVDLFKDEDNGKPR